MEVLAVITAKRRRALRPAAQAECVGALLASLLMLGGCASKPAKSEAIQMEFRVPVTVAKAIAKSVPVQVEVIGNVEAYSNVSVRTQMAGEIERAYFTQGQDVKKGQLLFTLDRRPFQAMLDQLEANLARDQAQLANARAQGREMKSSSRRASSRKTSTTRSEPRRKLRKPRCAPTRPPSKTPR